MTRRPPTMTLTALAIAAAALAGASALQAGPSTAPAVPEHAPGRVIVAFHPDASPAARAQVRSAAAATSHAPLSPLARDTEIIGIRAADVPAAAAALARNPHVRFAEPDWKVSPAATSNDPGVTSGKTWGLYGPATSPANAFGSRAMEAWAADRTGSRDIAVGIIDTGIDINHPDLKDNIFTNPGEIAGNGIDDDKNGYVDDVSGWDFHFNDKTVYDSATYDDHGTHVAGTIGAKGGNGIGVAGVNWDVTMIPAKFLGPSGGYISNAVKAADYLTDLKSRHALNLVASNNSWGGGGFSTAMRDAINRGGNAGILFVAAAGNSSSNNDTTASYPSNYQCTTSTRSWDCVVAVASITSTGPLSSFSSYGATTVDLGAAGSSIYSTVPEGKYASFSGTSMATPHVTGAIALCRAAAPVLGAEATRSALMSSIMANTALSGITVTGGHLNAAAMATACAGGPSEEPAPPPPPAAPSAFGKSSPSNGATGINASKIQLRWQAASGATAYEVCGDTVLNTVCDDRWIKLGNVTSTTLSGKRATTYYWQVRAINDGGTTEANAGTWWRFTTKR